MERKARKRNRPALEAAEVHESTHPTLNRPGVSTERSFDGTTRERHPMTRPHELERQRQALLWALLWTFPALVIIAAAVGGAVAVGAVLICASLACVVVHPERSPKAFFGWMLRWDCMDQTP